ncbi:hypothetical protein BC751_4257 [Cecembia calidifontis]|uniref:Uncharacterized protein n=1 Tax=Cecembia calidifontis TaxID=1187080 RepID=A0A4Q7PDX9_9BACT|nr:hypothetical protein BC751_4257 [Cecembia calidifontis]
MRFWGFFHYNKRKSIHRKTQGEQAEKPAFSPYFSKVRAKKAEFSKKRRTIPQQSRRKPQTSRKSLGIYLELFNTVLY